MMIANVTACQCVVVRAGQLDDQGKLTDAQAALSKSFTGQVSRDCGMGPGDIRGQWPFYRLQHRAILH
jgi:hypothetical protein